MSPSGIKRYGHKSMSDKGSKHPSGIGSGLQTVGKLGGSPPGPPDNPKGTDKHIRGVVRGSGTERLEGTKVTKKRGQIAKSIPRGNASNIPGEVSKHDGLKAPRSGRQPR